MTSQYFRTYGASHLLNCYIIYEIIYSMSVSASKGRYFTSLFLISNLIAAGQTTFSFPLTEQTIEISPFPGIVNGIIPATDYTQINKPLVAEPYANDAAFYATGEEIRPSAGNVGPVFFGGQGPDDMLGAIATCVFTSATFSETDLPMKMSGRFYAESLSPIDNEFYFLLIPAEYVYFGSPTYFYQQDPLPREGILVGGFPTFTYAFESFDILQDSEASYSTTHNIGSAGEWVDFSAVFSAGDNNELIINSVSLNGECVYADESVVLGSKEWLSNFRAGFSADDLAADFEITTNYRPLDFEIPEQICAAQCVNPTLSSEGCGAENYTYEWTFPGGQPSAATGSMPGEVCFADPGTYTITLTATSGTESFSTTRTLTVGEVPVVDLGPDTLICQGNPVLLDPMITADSYDWSTGATTPIITVSDAGTYGISVELDGCVATDTIVVGYLAGGGGISLGTDQILCAGETVTLNATVADASAYLWSTGDTTATIEVATSGTYSVSVSIDSECMQLTDEVFVDVLHTDFQPAYDSELILCVGDSLLFELPLPAATTFVWEDGDTVLPVRIDRGGNYRFSLRNACAEQSFPLRVREAVCCEPWFPNAVSPNRDGINDVFRAYYDPTTCGGLTSYRLQIWNRWGSPVFETTAIDAGWDGTERGDPAAAGVYAWAMQYSVGNNVEYLSGSLTLLR